MTKHLFQTVSRGSSNIATHSGRSEKRMKQKAIILFAVILAASMLVGTSLAQPTVNPPVVQPGDTVAIAGQTTADTTVTISISNTRAQIDAFNITSDQSGLYTHQYQLPEDAAIDIYTVTITVDDETSESSFIVSKMTQEQLASTIRTIVLNAKKQAETILIQARRQGQTVPEEARTLYQQGQDHLEAAVEAIENQNFAEAQAELSEAMNKFREIVAYNYGETVEPPVDPLEAHNRVQEQLDQLIKQYNQINATVQRLGENGLNVDQLERDLETLRNRINEAERLLEEGDVEEAEKIAIETRRTVTQRLESLRLRQAEVTKRLAENYQTSLEKRVEAYIDTFQTLQSVRPAQSALALQELEQLQEKLSASKNELDAGNMINALRELQSTEIRLKRLSSTVNGPVTSRLLNKIDELTADLEKSPGNTQIRDEIEDAKETLRDYLRAKRVPVGSVGAVSP
ncbi:MAG: hypothetical protein NWF07_07065 [Candidatus Bathyarchaeota archaeon]|nr:hypothetical protein [Candidatus Bathyarchaeota archaeon]